MVSIVGFGRPKFGNSTNTTSKPSGGSASKSAKVDPKIQAAIDLLTSKGYKITK